MRLQKTTMQTNDLAGLKSFYGQLLGLLIHYEDERSFEIITGPSTIRFEANEAIQNPFYHFAWNIPENLYTEAAEWIKAKGIALVKEPGTDNEILDFTDWNAHAIYFNDPAGNIVELIARHDLDNASGQAFNEESFFELSEIGLVAKDYQELINYIANILLVPLWKGNNEDFNAYGDEHGLFIIVPQRRAWFMSDRKATAFPLELNFTSEGGNKTVYF